MTVVCSKCGSTVELIPGRDYSICTECNEVVFNFSKEKIAE